MNVLVRCFVSGKYSIIDYLLLIDCDAFINALNSTCFLVPFIYIVILKIDVLNSPLYDVFAPSPLHNGAAALFIGRMTVPSCAILYTVFVCYFLHSD